MSKFILLLISLLSLNVYGLTLACHPDGVPLNSVEQLDQAYEKAEIVFLANVEFDKNSENPIRWQYSTISPILKGSVEPTGYLNHAENTWCNYVEATIKGVYLVFWQAPNEVISNENTKLVVYGGAQVYEEWVLNWAKSKTYNKAVLSPSAGTR